jgi:hypothetical protein
MFTPSVLVVALLLSTLYSQALGTVVDGRDVLTELRRSENSGASRRPILDTSAKMTVVGTSPSGSSSSREVRRDR